MEPEAIWWKNNLQNPHKKMVAPLNYLQCNAYQLKKQAVTNTLVGMDMEDGSAIKTPLVQHLPAWEASCDKYRCYTYTMTEALYIGKTAYDKY